jgi:hypothetical protein
VGYSIELPGEWQTAAQDVSTAVGVIKVYRAIVTAGQRAYMTMYSHYPEGAVRRTPVTSILDGARDGAVANVKGKLRSEQKILISNLPARHVVIDTPDRHVVVARYFLLRDTLVQGLVVGPSDVELEPVTKRVLESLKVVSP